MIKLIGVRSDLPVEKDEGVILIAMDGAIIVGSAIIAGMQKSVPIIQRLSVLKDQRRKGIGMMMIQWIIKECEMADRSAVSLNVKKTNIIAIALYRKCKFFNSWIHDDDIFMTYQIKR